MNRFFFSGLFKNYNIVIDGNSLSAFYSCLSEENKQDAPATHSHMFNIYLKLIV